MAREPSVLNEDESGDSVEDTDDTGGKSGLLHRRSYLKLAGTATAAAAVAGATNTTAAQTTDLDIRGDVDVEQRDGYTEIVCHDDMRIDVKDGQTVENLLIRNNGHYVNFNARDTDDFVIRNVGLTDPTPAHGSAILSTATSTEGLVENVYLGEGGRGDWRDKHAGGSGEASSKAMFSHREHTGEITVRNVYFGPFADNTCYLESQGSGGDFHLENCYAYGGCISIFRLGGDGSHTVRNCHVENAGYHPDNNHGGSRDVWIRSGTGSSTIDIYDSHLDGSGSGIKVSDDGPVRLHGDTQYGGGNGDIVEVDDTVGRNPNPTVPDSVPTSAEEAATSGDSGTGSDPEPAEPTFGVTDLEPESVTVGTSEAIDVSATVANTGDGAGTQEIRVVVGGTAVDAEELTLEPGEETSVSFEGLDLSGLDTGEYVHGVSTDDDEATGTLVIDERLDLSNVILVDGDDSATTRYEFAVGGEVEKASYDGASIDDEEVIEDGLVHGAVADWKDAFRFNGELEDLTVDGPATVYVNGEAVDPSDYGEDLPHVLRVEGRGVPTNYEITVDGSIELASGNDPEDDATTVSGATVQSSVTDDSQEFNFSGAITDVTFSDGEATVFVDGEEIDPAEYGDHQLLPHALIVDGNGTDGASSYSFKVGGTAIKSDHLGASIDDEDVIEGRTVRGVVAGWLDAYWFDGNVEDLTLLGDATARIEYNARDQ